jgi:RHS repeat-associated protein
VTKSQRVTNSSGTVTSTIDLDPWGGETNRSANSAFQPHKYTTYERDGNGGDDAMMRRYTAKWHRFSQPDPYDGSYDATDPQSLNRYAYVQNDPANFTDPSGLNPASPGTSFGGSYRVSWTATGHFIGDTLIGITDFRYSISPRNGRELNLETFVK